MGSVFKGSDSDANDEEWIEVTAKQKSKESKTGGVQNLRKASDGRSKEAHSNVKSRLE